MTDEYFKGLGTADKLWHVASNPNAARFAYDRLAVCRLAAEIQMRRLWEAAAASRSATQEPEPNAPLSEIRAFFADAKKRMAPLIYETHYYFVAWSNCGNMLRVLTGQPEFLEAKKVFDSYRKHFEHYTAGRNSFEHYHDRLPGNTEQKKVREVVQSPGAGPSRIYFGFSGGEFKHSDMSWNITLASLDLLGEAIDDTLAVLHRQIDELFVAKFGAV